MYDTDMWNWISCEFFAPQCRFNTCQKVFNRLRKFDIDFGKITNTHHWFRVSTLIEKQLHAGDFSPLFLSLFCYSRFLFGVSSSKMPEDGRNILNYRFSTIFKLLRIYWLPNKSPNWPAHQQSHNEFTKIVCVKFHNHRAKIPKY